jgi:hypothetical protein
MRQTRLIDWAVACDSRPSCGLAMEDNEWVDKGIADHERISNNYNKNFSVTIFLCSPLPNSCSSIPLLFFFSPSISSRSATLTLGIRFTELATDLEYYTHRQKFHGAMELNTKLFIEELMREVRNEIHSLWTEMQDNFMTQEASINNHVTELATTMQ